MTEMGPLLSTSLSRGLDMFSEGINIVEREALARIGEYHPVKPRNVNFMVNDICNAECQMCNIWQQEPEEELSPAELEDILRDPLFDKLEYIGVSGGEPTLRKDLPEMYEAIVSARPDIEGTGIITNGLVPKVVIDRIEQSIDVVEDAGVDFNVMVSLDGVGEVHDRVRGTEGAFENATSVMRHFRDNTDAPVSVGCTITKDNVWNVHDVYDFCKEENVDYKFRVAEFIDRLYNDTEENGEYIRNFTDREAYHLGLFFSKLEHETDFYSAHYRTYRNNRKMLMEGADRDIGCLAQSIAVTLDSKGKLSYCSPKSPDVGDCRKQSAERIYRENTEVRGQIIENHCDDCIHDYPSPKMVSELSFIPKKGYWRTRLSLKPVLLEAKAYDYVRTSDSSSQVRAPDSALVFGWYGTETAGDKAILGQILHELYESNPDISITLASLNPYLSRWTVQELGHPEVDVINTYSQEFVDNAKTVDEVIMGGGPLMHIDTLAVVLKAFMAADRAGNHTRIAGCGIGPLDKGGSYREAVRYILDFADTIELRNDGAVEAAKKLVNRSDIENTGDPAFEFVRRWNETHSTPEKQPYLNLYLRQWPREYAESMSDQEYQRTRQSFEAELAEWIATVCEQDALTPRLLPMHHFHVGDDDRVFNRRFAEEHLAHLDPVVERRPLTVSEILTTMQEGERNICMRYHSSAFANELGVDFHAIDYSLGGKVARYLSERNRDDRMLDLREVADGKWQQVV